MDGPRRLPFRRVRSLLWNEIAALLNPGERDVVRKSIGSNIIDDNEMLFREAIAYEEILQFVDEDMQRHVGSHKILDTPARQMLEKEIKILVEHIQGSSSSDGQQSQTQSQQSGIGFGADAIAPDQASTSTVKPMSPRKSAKNPLNLQGRCKNTLDYVMSKSAIQERQKSANPSQFPPCRSEIFRPGAGSGDDQLILRKVAVDPSLIVRKMAPHLNVTGIDAINDRLRHAFAAEHEALLEDVESLRAYLEDSADVYSSVKNNPPSISDMKDCGKKLEEKWTALKHCQNIQSILAPIDRIQGGGGGGGRGGEDTKVADHLSVIGHSKRSIRLPKMLR